MRTLLPVLALFLALGCVHQTREASPIPREAPECLSADAPAPRYFRHAVRLRVPGKRLDLTFEGMMRLDARNTARIVGMGAFGLRMFDIIVTHDRIQTNFLHPAMRKIPRIDEHIAFCARRIWLGFQPGPCDTACSPDDGATRCGGCGDVRLAHTYAQGRLIRTMATGPDESWSIEYSGHDENTGEPGQIAFRDGKGRFELDIRQISQGAKP